MTEELTEKEIHMTIRTRFPAELSRILFVSVMALGLACSKEVEIPTVRDITGGMIQIAFEPANQLSEYFLQAVKNGEEDLVEEFARETYKGDEPFFVYLDMKDESGWTPLLWATHYNHEEIVRILIEAGADPNTRAPDGATALILAVLNNSTSMTKLITRFIDDVDCVDSSGRSPLMLAVQRGNIEIVEALLAKDANVYARDDQGRSILDVARANRSTEIYLLLSEEANKWRFLTTSNKLHYEYRALGDGADSREISRVWFRQTIITANNDEKIDGVSKNDSQESYFLLEAKCQAAEIRQRQSHWFEGGKLSTKPGENEWSPVLPGTVGESWYRVACLQR